ncbi:hypothetical protein GGF41_000860, partial [Coemansia sp. RSA 2531]
MKVTFGILLAFAAATAAAPADVQPAMAPKAAEMDLNMAYQTGNSYGPAAPGAAAAPAAPVALAAAAPAPYDSGSGYND